MDAADGRSGEATSSFYDRTWRWWVLGTLFLATFLNYFDRQTLGAALTPITEEFGIDNEAKGRLLAAFLWTYGAAHLFVGVAIDRIRSIRWFFPAMLIGWSVTTILTGFARNVEHLIWMRYLLGVFESVNFPICIMVIARIFPANERSLASGIFASGAFLATLIAPKAVIYFSTEYDWRYSFIFAGLLGLVWLLPWLLIFRNPDKRAVNWERQRAGVAQTEDPLGLLGLGSVLCAPAFWGVALIGIGIIPSLYFSTQWLPTCLEKSLGLSYDQELGNCLMLIYLMQDAGLWLGGVVVLVLARRFSILGARKIVIAGGYVLMVCVVLLPLMESVAASVAVFCLFTFGIGVFLGNQHAFKQDVVKSHTATVAAWVGFIEMMFTAFVVQEVGKQIGEQSDFVRVYVALAGLATFALVAVLVLMQPRWVKIE